MPEILEIEMYRRAALDVVGRPIVAVDAPDAWYLKGTHAAELGQVVVDSTVTAVGRVGKLMLVELDTATLGLRFGMTGRLVVDGEPTIETLEYSSRRLDPAWDRFTLHFGGGGSLAMNDPRRLGGVELEPDRSALGVDAWLLDGATLRSAVAKRRVAIKALLLNQKVIAGLGNLLVDELLWRAGVSPVRQSSNVTGEECDVLAEMCAVMLPELYARGGSNTGDLFEERHSGGRCPSDGSELRRDDVGGRTTWWCAEHQR